MEKVKKKLWEEFERHYLIETNVFEWLIGDVKLLEEGKIGNYSSFPHALEIWNDLLSYIEEYVKNNEPSDGGIYGKYYLINVPDNFTIRIARKPTRFNRWRNRD